MVFYILMGVPPALKNWLHWIRAKKRPSPVSQNVSATEYRLKYEHFE